MADLSLTQFECSADLSPAELRRAFARDSFLFFRGLLDPAVVARVRNRVLAALASVRWLKSGSDPTAGLPGPTPHHDCGVINGQTVVDSQWRHGYQAVQSIEELHQLAHSPPLLDVLARLLQTDVVVHPRKIARISFPRLNFATPPHQDALFNQIPGDVLTAWIPLGDCTRQLGPLQVLRGSADLGVLPVIPSEGLGGERVELPASQCRWVGGDYRCGDVVIFHSRTVHKTTPNIGGRVRLSLDCRFQSTADPIKISALLPHGHLSGRLADWNILTRGWTSTRWVEPGHPVRVAAVSSGSPPPRLVGAGVAARGAI